MRLYELKIIKPKPEDTMGIPRKDMPQVATKDYPEFMDYLKNNGAKFKKETVSADSLKAVQGEFSDAGVEKALIKNKLKKASIVSSDNYIIDGHHRWIAALNTGSEIDIIRVNISGKELLELVKKFDKTTYKDIYTEGYKLQLERGNDMDVLHITDTRTGKRTEVRGKTGYESGNYDANDSLHKLLDKIGKAANISELINGEPVGINPNHPDGDRARKDTDKAFSEDSPYGWAKRKLGHIAYADQYANAAKTLHNILMRKYKETNGSLRHSLGYYAHMLSRQTGEKLNWREIEKEYLNTFGNTLFENNSNNNYGIPKNATLSQLDKIAKTATGEKRERAHFLRNMKRGANKKK